MFTTKCISLWLLALSLLASAFNTHAQAVPSPSETSLAGTWSFALDPLSRGQSLNWHQPDPAWTGTEAEVHKGWDTVTVPHTWNIDPRYAHDGTAWYRRSFQCPPVASDEVVRLRFAAVYYKCRVWVNGQLVGTHEGGYTPFEIDITSAVKPGTLEGDKVVGGWNAISVEVDNRWDETTLPGARPGSEPNAQLFPWWNYGGITHDVTLKIHKNTFVELTKIETEVDLPTNTATVSVTGWIRNAGSTPRTVTPSVVIAKELSKGVVGNDIAKQTAEPLSLQPGQQAQFKTQIALAAADVELWHIGKPALYQASVQIADASSAANDNSTAPLHTLPSTFGLRKIEIKDAQLLLNGRPIRMGGGNRVNDHPLHGGCQPKELIDQDMSLLKNGHMVLSRLQHQPLDASILDYADRNGMLLIQEAANWGFPPAHMENQVIREKFRQQTQAMIQSSWNHPSVIGYSVGNEYISWSPEGERWTRDMRAFVKSVDDTRYVVFVSLSKTGGLAVEAVNKGETDPNRWSVDSSDIICINIYDNAGPAAKWMDAMHKLWPEKPIFISEYGLRVDKVKDEAARIKHFNDYIAMLQSRPWVIGLSYWSFNDYRSRYPGSGENGYRPWGLVLPDRTPRGLYTHMLTALSPATLTLEGSSVTVTAKSGFPSMDLHATKLVARKADGTTLWQTPVPTVQIGNNWSTTLPPAATEGDQTGSELVLLSHTGHVLARVAR